MSKPGKGFRGVLNYDLADKKQPELIASNMGAQTARGLASEFGHWRALNERVTKPVLHVSLAAAPADRMTVPLWTTLAETYLDRLGYRDSPWVAIRHGDRPHDHIHIVASRIDAQGLRVADHQERARGEAILRDLERDLGLHQVAPSREAPRTAPTRGQVARFERTGHLPVAPRLQEHLDLAARNRPTMTLFVERLEAAGIQVRPNLASTNHVSGISFAFDGLAFKGSDLGRTYSWKGLQDRLGVTYDPDRDLPTLRAAATRAAAPVAPAANGPTSPGAEPMPPLDHPVEAYRAAAVLASRVELHERHERLGEDHRQAADTVDGAKKLREERDRLGSDLAARERALELELQQVFQKPAAARRRLDELVASEGHARAAHRLAHHPEQFGILRGLALGGVKNASRREALAAARRAARHLSGIGRIRAHLSALDDQVSASAPTVGRAKRHAAATAKARGRLPSLASLRRDIAGSAARLGTRVVRGMPPAAGTWVARVLRTAGRKYRELLQDRSSGREGDGPAR